MSLDDVARSVLRRWKAQPVDMVRELFHVEPDAWQLEALDAFPKVNRLAMKACKGPGKTAVLAWLIWNFLLTRPFPKVGATSISEDNLDNNLWPELAKWQHMSPLLTQAFSWTKTRIESREHPERWFCAARTWPRTADPQRQAQTLAGFHGEYCLYVLDESGSMPQAIMTTAEAVLASGLETKVLQAGNPEMLEGPLYRACTEDRALWHIVEITGDPEDPKRSPRISLEWANQEIAKWGRENPWVMVNVLGKFPPSSLNALLGVEEVMAAMHRHLDDSRFNWAQKRLGVDVARFGDDLTVLFPRQGRAAFRPKAMRHKRNSAASVDIATAVMKAKTTWGSEMEFIDATGGWAAGARDILVDSGYAIQEVQFAAPALDPRYENRRAEMWFNMATWVQEGGALPHLPEVVREFTTPTYTFRKGKFVLEPKDQIKARLGWSPNYADALATTFCMPEMPAAMLALARKAQELAREERSPLEHR
ncbi:MAG TPA: hypothetical protein VKB41_08505 [Steroidobacteraceae bacterium]|nr:hypothetical protein [Steroidobacteraceae bacterium]